MPGTLIFSRSFFHRNTLRISWKEHEDPLCQPASTAAQPMEQTARF